MRIILGLCAAVSAFWIAGCGSDNAEPNPTPSPEASVSDAETEASDASVDAPDDAADGADSPAYATRGDPSTFPTECTASCEEACTQLQTCGGENSSYPIVKDLCLQRCQMAGKSTMWDDLSGNFRCCATQTSCDDVAPCGGWLKHTAVKKSCDKLCTCFFGASIGVPSDAPLAPSAYRYSDDSLVVELNSSRAPLPVSEDLEIVSKGRYTVLRVRQGAEAKALITIQKYGRILPTFRGEDGRLSAASGGIIITVKTPASLSSLSSFLTKRATPKPSKITYSSNLYYLKDNDPLQSLRTLHALNALPGIHAELDMVRTYVKNSVPNDPLFPDQWHLLNKGEKGAIAGVDGRVSEAWDLTKGSSKAVIAINDDGTDVKHPDLAANCLPPLNFPADWESQVGVGLTGGFGSHGSSCAGVAAAIGDNDLGGSGVCPSCRLLPHLLGETTGVSFNITDKDIADGFAAMVDGGAWVISNSWGPGGGDPRFHVSTFGSPAPSAAVLAAFEHAEKDGRGGKGTVVLFAAGNENEKVSSYAAVATNLAIAAVDDQGLKSYYSNFGPQIAVAAPSNGGILGITTVSATAAGQTPAFTSAFGGTSSACPFVAGVAGLILSANENLSAAEVRDIIRKSASRIDPVYGKWDADGHSTYYGSGLVNAYRAVKMAKGECADPKDCPAPSDACAGAPCNKPLYASCTSQEQCAAGTVCQAVPTAAAMLCISPTPSGGCPAETEESAGYCIPSRKAAELCSTKELCNGYDDDCNGAVDETLTCAVRSPDCGFNNQGCSSTQICAGTYCATGCTTDADCAEGSSCSPAKDRYGVYASSKKGCAADGASSCKIGCQILASSLDDAKLESFVTCMNNGSASCTKAQSCAAKLPIKF